MDELTDISNQKHPQGTGSQVQGTKAADALLASATIATAMAMVKRMVFGVRMLLGIVE